LVNCVRLDGLSGRSETRVPVVAGKEKGLVGDLPRKLRQVLLDEVAEVRCQHHAPN